MTALWITHQGMTSDTSPHYATPVDPARPYGWWRVSWLPARCLSYSQAVTAMTIAETVAAIDAAGSPVHQDPRDRRRVLLATLAAELDMIPADALAAVSAGSSPTVPPPPAEHNTTAGPAGAH